MIDITVDGLGQAHFETLDKCYNVFDYKSLNSNGLYLSKTKNQNDWKYEIKIGKEKFQHIRLKFYNKTADKITNFGISSKSLRDPLSRLLISGKKEEKDYNKLLIKHKKSATCRIECSFYGSELKKPETYIAALKVLFN